MSTELLSLALAAAMPLAVFAIYLLVRSLRDARSRPTGRARWAGRTRTAARVSPAAGVRPAVRISTEAPTDHPEPAADPDPGRPVLEPAPIRTAPTPAVRPQAPALGVLAKLPVSRPSPFEARPDPQPEMIGVMAPRGEPADRMPAAQPQAAAGRAPVLDRPVRAQPRRPGLLSGTLDPIRTALGRGANGRGSGEPQWPEHEPDGSYRLFEYFADASDACPVCEESRERGAWFCRRCGRPVNERTAATPPTARTTAIPLAPPPTAAPPATVRVGAQVDARPTGPPVAPAQAAAGTTASRPAASRPTTSRPTATGSGSVITRLPVIRPTRDRLADDRADVAAAESRATDTSGAMAAPRADARPARKRARADGPRSSAAASPGNGAPDGRIDLNHATAAQLSSLRGVGRVTAQRIIAARNELAFPTVDALADRKIIGRSSLERLRDQVTV